MCLKKNFKLTKIDTKSFEVRKIKVFEIPISNTYT